MTPKIILAPMEGVVDSIMRHLLTKIGGIDYCATEFIRVTDRPVPNHVFFRDCPELKQNCQTSAGTPIFIQLLGGSPKWLADHARRACELGAHGIDLNFGCPARTVNRHDGGATLLKNPHRLFDIVHSVRAEIPTEIPVTAKIRLGYEDKSLALENAHAAAEGGAYWLTVHARTKLEGYKPPAHWDWIAKINESLSTPVVANGDIWTVEDFHRCREVTGCHLFMIGRGLIANPFLAREIQKSLTGDTQKKPTPSTAWQPIQEMLPTFASLCNENRGETFALHRMKQWVRLLGRNFQEAQSYFEKIKRASSLSELY